MHLGRLPATQVDARQFQVAFVYVLVVESRATSWALSYLYIIIKLYKTINPLVCARSVLIQLNFLKLCFSYIYNGKLFYGILDKQVNMLVEIGIQIHH